MIRMRLLLMLIALAAMSNFSIYGQVTIGMANQPASGALLQLKNKTETPGSQVNADKGLMMPRVELISPTDLFPMFDEDSPEYTEGTTKSQEDILHTGLLVKNIATVPGTNLTPGLYVWDGAQWIRLGEASVIDVTLNKNQLNLYTGDIETLIASIFPTDANPSVAWSSSNPTVATVDSDGKVTALNDGIATITVTTTEGNKTANCTVYVIDPSGYLPAEPNEYYPKGKFCFDIAKTGDLTNRTNEFREDDKVTERYIWDYSVIGITEQPLNLVATTSGSAADLLLLGPPVVNGNTITLSYNKAQTELVTPDGLRFTLVMYFENSAGRKYTLERQITVQDKSCCEGYLSISGEYVAKAPLNQNLGSSDYYSWANTQNLFIATGNDICFYKTDSPTRTKWQPSKDACANGSAADGKGDNYWRLPSAAELGNLQGIRGSLNTQPTSVPGTTNMDGGSGAAGYYWSNHERVNNSETATWRYSTGLLMHRTKSFYNYSSRCVRTM